MMLNNIAIAQEVNDFGDDITFTVDKVDRWRQIYTGTGYEYAEKGYKIMMVYLNFNNSSNSKQILDFERLQLIDTVTNIAYPISSVLAKGVVNRPFLYNQAKIKSGKNREVKLAILYPEHLVPRFLLLDEEYLIPLDEKIFKRK
jgi:hypothetical protein